jgi:dTMP kinase
MTRGSGFFIAFEGVEGAGKSTQVALLAARLRAAGVEPVLVREPGGTPLAEAARRLLLHGAEMNAASELFLLLAARADLVGRVIRPALDAGKVVVADRFELSTRAYQVAGRGLPAEAVHAAIGVATGGLVPDLYVVLEVTPATGRGRRAALGRSADRIERADDGFHERVAGAFRAATGPGHLHLDADRDAALVHADVWAALEPLLAARSG